MIVLKETSPLFHEFRAKWIPVIWQQSALKQDYHELRIGILNLMSTIQDTEKQLFDLLANTPTQIYPVSIRPVAYNPKGRVEKEHLDLYYKTFDQIKENNQNSEKRLHGLIITWANVWHKNFEDVPGWEQIKEIFDWALENVHSTLYYCWAAHAGLYYHYRINRTKLDKKTFWVFDHQVFKKLNSPILRKMDDIVKVCQSRLNTVLREHIEMHSNLKILMESQVSWVHLVEADGWKMYFMQGHPEYEDDTIKNEYARDKETYIKQQEKYNKIVDMVLNIKSNADWSVTLSKEIIEQLSNKPIPPVFPSNYFPDDNVAKQPLNLWSWNWQLLYSNWINLIAKQVFS